MERNTVYRLLVGNDVDGTYAGTTINTVENQGVAAFTKDSALLTNQVYGAVETTTTTPSLTLVQGTTTGNINSTPILGNRVYRYEGSPWTASVNQISTVGYDGNTTINTNLPLSTGAGSIPVAPNTEYTLTLNFKDKKSFFSYFRRYTTVTGAAPTQLSIATAAATAINSDLQTNGSKPGLARATVIGDGTGLNGLTGATNYGIKLVGLFPDVFFSVHLDLGWTAARNITHVENTLGVGNMSVNDYEGLDYFEKWVKGQALGVQNLIWLPANPDTYVEKAGFASATTHTTNGTATSADNVISLTSVAGLVVGQRISINGNFYKIEVIDTTNSDIRIEGTFGVAVGSGDTLIKYAFYSLVTIVHEGEQEIMFDNQRHSTSLTTIVAVPFYRDTATQAYFITNLLSSLNNYMNSTPFNFAPITGI
jgi:hypothetical protein